MPLTRVSGIHRGDKAVVFMMRDTQSGRIVPCKISSAALARLAGRSGPIWLTTVFDEHRTTIEAIASRMYDAGDATPFLTEGDV